MRKYNSIKEFFSAHSDAIFQVREKGDGECSPWRKAYVRDVIGDTYIGVEFVDTPIGQCHIHYLYAPNTEFKYCREDNENLERLREGYN